ncbi:hypothetical protein MACJ_003479 [Theileria orientalis]|uniref:RRM domain-containing protein n=1 Tax=Theileria orientalis TaxID=68886 RepID=A0A976SK82_THEOR|nr:hypothetical protein MACJ_003479 [Theileria orientalis]
MGDSQESSSGSSKSGYTVKITNIPSQIDESSLQRVMSHFGSVKSCRLTLGDKTTDPATAWVTYTSFSEVESALKADGKLECGGCKLKIARWHEDVPVESQQLKRKLTESSTCQEACWFCLSNDQCETHMISYVSKHSYVALAKGALCEMHSLVVPIYHYPSLGSAPLDVQMDMKNVMDALFDVALQKGMGAIAFERFVPMTMKVAMHTQLQVVAVPMHTALRCFDFVDKSEVFRDATRITFESEEPGFHELTTRVNNNTQYLYLQAVGKSLDSDNRLCYSRCLWVFNRPNSPKIPTHFGREIAISVLSHEDLNKIDSLKKVVGETGVRAELAAVDWHNCRTTREGETVCAKNMSRLILSLK